MTLSDITVALTGERMMGKDTSGRPRPSRDEIARLAYRFYETRGRREGHDLDDWLSAERALTYHYRVTESARFGLGGFNPAGIQFD